ncbi:hypothetical protein GJ744_009824 [Endocarpon pusillum]|uniref:Uncharacterized protein n=1 Tax=Endocarpon pusillum TaxID=364733 RepID=A0A8H7E9N9_9EURO|nr:hypothetical protein GJ744_009824 [Endocarpon pusillum]
MVGMDCMATDDKFGKGDMLERKNEMRECCQQSLRIEDEERCIREQVEREREKMI